MEVSAMQSSRSGGFAMHYSFLLPGLQRPELKLQRAVTPAGQLSCGTSHWLPNTDMPCEQWLAPAELPKPFRLYPMLEDQMKWYTANFSDSVMPRDVLRSHLQEVLNPAALDQQTSCLGNRAAACEIGRKTLVFSCAGSAGQTVVMNVLHCKADPMQCLKQQQVPTGKPVQQLAISTVSAPRKKSQQQQQQQPHSTRACSSAADDTNLSPRGLQTTAANAAQAMTDAQTDGVQEAEALPSAHNPADGAQADARRAEGGTYSDEAKFKTSKASSGPEADNVQQAGVPSPPDNSCGDAEQCSVLIAARGSYQIMILQAVQAASGWVLQPVATVHSKHLVQHVTWSPFNNQEAAFICQDGSVHTLAVAAQPGGGQSVHTATVVSAGHAALVSDNNSARSCAWVHPRRLVCSSGRNLVQCQLLGRGQEARVVLVHSRPAGDNIVAIACPSEASAAQQRSYLVVSTMHHILLFDTCRFNSPVLCWAHGMDREPPQMLHLILSLPAKGESGQGTDAAASSLEAFPSSLQDSFPWSSQSAFPSQSQPWESSQAGANHPLPWSGGRGGSQGGHWGGGLSQAWPATQASQGPQPLAPPQGIHQGSTTGQGQFAGLILASSLALGACKAFRFRVAPSGQVIAAHPPEDSARKRMQRGLRTNWGLIEVQTATQSSPGGADHISETKSPVRWSPRLGNAVQATELPRLVCKPLKHMSDVTKGLPLIDMAEAHGEDEERMILQCPDLQGVAVLPSSHMQPDTTPGKGGPQQQPDYTLLRASFVGDIFLDPCFFFHALPADHAAQMRRQKTTLQCIAVPSSIGKHQHVDHDRQHVATAGPPVPAPATKRRAEQRRTQQPRGVPAAPDQSHAEAVTSQTETPGEHAPPERGPAESPAAPMVKHLDIRQTADNYYDKMRAKYADPRWKTDKSQVRFAQKGLFQVDVSVHHAMLSSAIVSYQKAASHDTAGELANQWGFTCMPERVAALANSVSNGVRTNTILPVVGATASADMSSLLTNLQGAVTVDELAARQRWNAAASSQANAAGNTEPAVPNGKFKFPDRSAVTARALQLVHTSRRKALNETGDDIVHKPAVDDICGNDISRKAVAACQEPSGSGQSTRMTMETRNLPLAAWAGARLGMPRRGNSQANMLVSPFPDSQASVHLTQLSQGPSQDGAAEGCIHVVPADRMIAGGDVVSPMVQATTWSGQPLLPLAWQLPVGMHSYFTSMEPSQEMDDIQSLEKLWLEARGQQSVPNTVVPLSQTTQQTASGVRAQQQHVHQPHPARRVAAPQLHASLQAALAAPSASQQVPTKQPLDTSSMQQSDTAQPAADGAGHMQYAPAVVSPARAPKHGAGFVDSLQPGVHRNTVTTAHRTDEASQQGVHLLSSPTDAAPVTQPSVASPRTQAQPRSVPQPKRKRKSSFVEGF